MRMRREWMIFADMETAASCSWSRRAAKIARCVVSTACPYTSSFQRPCRAIGLSLELLVLPLRTKPRLYPAAMRPSCTCSDGQPGALKMQERRGSGPSGNPASKSTAIIAKRHANTRSSLTSLFMKTPLSFARRDFAQGTRLTHPMPWQRLLEALKPCGAVELSRNRAHRVRHFRSILSPSSLAAPYLPLSNFDSLRIMTDAT